VYASLLLNVSRSLDDTRAASFHAARAAELAPVTVAVNRQSAMVLARCGRTDDALEIARSTFLFDPATGVRILESLLPLLGKDLVATGVPDDPNAWLAWSRSLEEQGAREEALARMEEAAERWPGRPRTVQFLAARALAAGDTDRFQAVFDQPLVIPVEPEHALLFGFRAVSGALKADREAMVRDLNTALELQGRNPSILRVCGDAWNRLGEPEQAADLWRRGLFQPSGSYPASVRIELLVRLALYEEDRMRFRIALDYWRQILALNPDHARAGQRVDELTGYRR
jgi:tetratricopeptide (TPR) repeat protein